MTIPHEQLSAAQRSKIRRLAAPGEAEAAGELNVVPYLDIITNVMMFVLATVAVTFVSSVDASAGVVNPREPRGALSSALSLSVLVSGQGVSIKTSSGNIAPGCEGVGGGITVPVREGAQDYAAVSRCVRRIKSARPDLSQERQVTVTASPGVEYETVIAVMDALRADEAGELFPEVHLGVVR